MRWSRLALDPFDEGYIEETDPGAPSFTEDPLPLLRVVELEAEPPTLVCHPPPPPPYAIVQYGIIWDRRAPGTYFARLAAWP
jgi:hypothetical protein